MAKKINEEITNKLDDLCMLANVKMGRPVKWDEETIRKFADELVEWAKQKTSLVLCSFTNEKLYDAEILSRLASLSTYFSQSLKTAKRLIGARRETGTLLKKFEPKTYSMSQRMYDPEWSNHMDLQLAKDELIKAQAKIKALEKAIDNKGEIMEYLKLQKKIDNV